MSLDKTKFEEEILKVKRIKASHISDGKINEIIQRLMEERRRPSRLDIEAAARILAKHGYEPNLGRDKGYINRDFGYRFR